MYFGKAIKFLRERNNKRQGVFATEIGITQAYLSMLENDKKKPSLDVLESMGKVLKIPLPVLFWFNVKIDDVDASKIELFKQLKPTIDNLIYEVFS